MSLDPVPILREIEDAVDVDETRRAVAGLASFVRIAWRVTEPATPFVPGWHLDAICEHLEAVTRGQIRNLLINIPPRHMKSLAVCVFWPVWEWISSPQRRWLFASYAQSLSIRDSLKCRRLIESPWFRRRFGDRFELAGDQNTKERFENDKGGHRIATSAGGAATGEGGDRVVVDDPHNVIDRESDLARQSALIWWDQTMSTRLNDPKTGAKVIVMQRIHEADLSGHVLKQGGYIHLCLPAEFEPARRCTTSIGWTDPRQIHGQLLWPRRFSHKELREIQTRLGAEGYAGQFQQRPAPAGGARFKSDWFRYYRTINDGPDARSGETEGPPSSAIIKNYVIPSANGSSQLISCDQCWRFAVMDPAATEATAGNDPCYTVIQVWDVTPQADMLLVHQYRRQVQAPDVVTAAIGIVKEFGPDFLAVEKDGIGQGIVQTIRRSGVTVKAIKARGSKESRTQTAEIRMSNGQIYFPAGAPFLFDLESELLSFPRSTHCDQVDALAHAAMLVQRRGEAVNQDTPSASAGCEEDEDA